MLKLLFILFLILFVVYIFRILRMLLYVKREMENITIQREESVDNDDVHSRNRTSKTIELNQSDYKIEK